MAGPFFSRLLTGCALFLACASFSQSAGEWPAERFVAIDNVCAWPNLTLLKNGTILSTIFNRPSHGLLEGDLECWASEDSGRSWRLQGGLRVTNRALPACTRPSDSLTMAA
jgi:hypothetical protein